MLMISVCNGAEGRVMFIKMVLYIYIDITYLVFSYKELESINLFALTLRDEMLYYPFFEPF